jgi:hypothetical protein
VRYRVTRLDQFGPKTIVYLSFFKLQKYITLRAVFYHGKK